MYEKIIHWISSKNTPHSVKGRNSMEKSWNFLHFYVLVGAVPYYGVPVQSKGNGNSRHVAM